MNEQPVEGSVEAGSTDDGPAWLAEVLWPFRSVLLCIPSSGIYLLRIGCKSGMVALGELAAGGSWTDDDRDSGGKRLAGQEAFFRQSSDRPACKGKWSGYWSGNVALVVQVSHIIEKRRLL